MHFKDLILRVPLTQIISIHYIIINSPRQDEKTEIVKRLSNKKIAVFEKVRTKKKALRRVKEILHQAVEKYGDLQAVVMHVNCEQQGRSWMEKLQSCYPTVHFKLAYFGPSLATHLGEGTLAISWMKR